MTQRNAAWPGLLRNSELWGGVVGLAFGAFVVRAGYKLKIGAINDPGSGFVLFYTGLLMCAFALAIIVAAIRHGGPTVASLWASTRWEKPVVVIACLAAFAALFQPLGFLLASIPLLLLLLRVIDPVRWSLAIPIAFIAPLTAWWVLKRLLAIQMPAGIFNIG